MSDNNNKNNNKNKNNNNRGGNNSGSRNNSRKNFHAASRETRRNQEMAQQKAGFDDVVTDAERARLIMKNKQTDQLDDNGKPKLRVVALGGQQDIGEKNLAIIEYGNDAIVVDAGFNLGVDLPGINYVIPDITYLESIKHKVRGYVFTHGHLDHIGAVPFILPKVPAPIYGSRFTIGMVEKQLEGSDLDIGDFKPESVAMNIDNNERLKIGPFFVELLRVTHSIPDCTGVIVDTPLGRIIHTGDFRLDPEPLDHRPTDIERIKRAGKDGVLLLMAESTDTERPGRTPTEHTLEKSFHDILGQSKGRVLISSFSSNINRVQMIVNAAAESGRKIAIDGRSLLSTVELAVKMGYIKIPKGTIVGMSEVPNLSDRNVVVVCTGSQGEPNSALQRMSTGDHKHLKIKDGDTVVFSSSVIPGNERSIVEIADDLMRKGASVFRHPTHEVDGCGPLHVSGHACRDEYKQMLEMTNPKYIMPNHGHYSNRHRYIDIAKMAGLPADSVALIENGEILEFDHNGTMKKPGSVPTGSVLIDQTGAVVPNLVIKDRLLMSNDGIVVVVLTIDKKTKRFLSSPDIISRGFIHMQENAEMIESLRSQLREFTKQKINRLDITQFKQELRDEVSSFLYQNTQRTAVIIPVVNMVASEGSNKQHSKQQHSKQQPQNQKQQQQQQQQQQG